MTLRNAAALSAISLIAWTAGCAYEDESVDSNGEEGALYLARASTYGGQCGPPAPPSGCEHHYPCWLQHLEPGLHELMVVRRMVIKSGNGLGDNSSCVENRELGQAPPQITVSPPGAATVGNVELCATTLRLGLTVHAAGALELAVTTESHVDRWALRAASSCESYSCGDAWTGPGPGKCD